MKKIKHILIVAIFLINSEFSVAHGGSKGLAILLLGGGASLISTIPLAATPYLFKENDTDYNYITTLKYSIVSVPMVPITLNLMGIDNDGVLLLSLLVAPIIGTAMGFHESKVNKKYYSYSSKNKGKKGWYSGIGIGGIGTSSTLYPTKEYGLTASIEKGYGFTEKFSIHYSLEIVKKDKYEHGYTTAGVGISYYISNSQYIKITRGRVLFNKPIDGEAAYGILESYLGTIYNIGYGNTIYKELGVELNYTYSTLNETLSGSKRSNMEVSTHSLGVLLKYRWF